MKSIPRIGMPISVDDPVLADLVDAATAQLQAGHLVDPEALAEKHPEYVGQLRELLPALEALAGVVTGSAPPVAAQDLPMGKLGDFRLIREIGRGGMGVVYEAEQLSLSRRVALKLLSGAAALDPRQRQRFMHEAQSAARLHHSNIVPVFGVGCEQGVHFYVMQYIEGQTLAALIADLQRGARDQSAREAPTVSSAYARLARGQGSDLSQPSPTSAISIRSKEFFRTAVTLAIQAAEALDYAHQMGLVHRDIKPANLLIDERGNLWVTDFGLARSQADTGLTQTGDVIGTLRYMSPEQALARRGLVDHRTDIYALGVTLYEFLTLSPAFRGNDRRELLDRLSNAEPTAPRRLNQAIPAELETVVLKALAKNLEERYATAQELADDLRRFLADKPIKARRPSLLEKGRRWLRRRRAIVRAAAILAVLAVGALAGGLFYVSKERDLAMQHGRQARQAVDEMYTEVAEKWLASQPYLKPLQRDFLLKALAFYEDLSRTLGGDPSVRLETAKAYRRVGEIERRLGEPEKARIAYAEAQARILALVEEAPKDAAARAELGTLENHRGDLCRISGDLRAAREAHERAKSVFAELSQQSATSTEYRLGLAASDNNLGLVLHDLHAEAEAEKAYHEAIALFHELALAEPLAPANRHFLAVSHANLAVLLRDRKQHDEAEKEGYRALALWKNLLEANPAFPQYRQSQAVNYLNLGMLFETTHQEREARKALHLAVTLLDKLAVEFPYVPIYGEQLRDARKRLATLDKRNNGDSP
jgi:serine/threonine protein kinase